MHYHKILPYQVNNLFLQDFTLAHKLAQLITFHSPPHFSLYSKYTWSSVLPKMIFFPFELIENACQLSIQKHAYEWASDPVEIETYPRNTDILLNAEVLAGNIPK